LPVRCSAATALSYRSWRDAGRTRATPIAAQHGSISKRGRYCIGPNRQDQPASLEMIDRQEGELFRQSASLPPA
jgi:hypothetical protein